MRTTIKGIYPPVTFIFCIRVMVILTLLYSVWGGLAYSHLREGPRWTIGFKPIFLHPNCVSVALFDWQAESTIKSSKKDYLGSIAHDRVENFACTFWYWAIGLSTLLHLAFVVNKVFWFNDGDGMSDGEGQYIRKGIVIRNLWRQGIFLLCLIIAGYILYLLFPMTFFGQQESTALSQVEFPEDSPEDIEPEDIEEGVPVIVHPPQPPKQH